MTTLKRPGRTAAAGDAVDLLLECHERIRSFLALARRIAEAGAEEHEAVVEAAERVRRYFSEALPLHARDEDESLLPRLRGRDPGLDAELEAMAREHREHERPLGELVAACEQIARAPGLLPGVAPVLARATAELERHFVAHLGREEAVIFPAVRRLLDGSVDAAIVREIRARRGVVQGAPAPPDPGAARQAGSRAASAPLGSVRVRDSARREWSVEPRRDARGRSLVVSPVHGDNEPFHASADGYRPDTHLAIDGAEWTLLARLAAGQQGDEGREDEALRAEACRIVDRMVRSAHHRLLMGAADEDDDRDGGTP